MLGPTALAVQGVYPGLRSGSEREGIGLAKPSAKVEGGPEEKAELR